MLQLLTGVIGLVAIVLSLVESGILLLLLNLSLWTSDLVLRLVHRGLSDV